MEENKSEAVEISLQDAVKKIEGAGGKAYLSTSALDEAIQKSDLYKEESKRIGLAYKKAANELANLTGVPPEEDERYEAYAERVIGSLSNKKEEPKKQESIEEIPEYKALLTQIEEQKAKYEELNNELSGYREKETVESRRQLLKEALGGKEIALPEGLTDGQRATLLAQFEADILGQVESWEKSEKGQTLITVNSATYSDPKGKLAELIESSGYKFKGTKPANTNFELNGKENISYEQRIKLTKEAANKKGIQVNTKQFWELHAELGGEIPSAFKQLFKIK